VRVRRRRASIGGSLFSSSLSFFCFSLPAGSYATAASLLPSHCVAHLTFTLTPLTTYVLSSLSTLLSFPLSSSCIASSFLSYYVRSELLTSSIFPRRRPIRRINTSNTKARPTAAAMPPPSAPLPALPPNATSLSATSKLGGDLAAPFELGIGGGGPLTAPVERVPLVDIDVDMRDN
jgi:hypothetical protein